MREESPHDRYRVLGDWDAWGALLADSKYTDLMFPDHELEYAYHDMSCRWT